MESFQDKIVVVTGGSEGFGLALANEYAKNGATCVLLARSETKLSSVCESATVGPGKFDGIVCDVTLDESVTAAVAEILKRHGRIDIWVNNVGKSTRLKFEDGTVEQYQDLMELNFYSAVRCTMAALDALVESSGQVINIGSLAAKTAWKSVGPYSASKHALAAFSHQFRVEGPSNVNCLLVCPGPIKRTDSATRYDEQAAALDENARKPGAGVNLKGIEPEKLAGKIVRYSELRKKELVMPWKSRILFSLAQLSPTLGDFLLRRASS